MLTSWRSMRDTGKAVWDTTVADYRQGYTFTSRPLAAHGKNRCRHQMGRIEGDFEKGSADGAKESLRVVS
jgi:hypothetical protein